MRKLCEIISQHTWCHYKGHVSKLTCPLKTSSITENYYLESNFISLSWFCIDYFSLVRLKHFVLIDRDFKFCCTAFLSACCVYLRITDVWYSLACLEAAD